jgi:hypothetical protein
LKALLIVLEICIVELHHSPDGSFGGLEKGAGRRFGYVNGLKIFLVTDEYSQVSNDTFRHIKPWHGKYTARGMGAIGIWKIKPFKSGNFQDIIKVRGSNVGDSLNCVNLTGPSNSELGIIGINPDP